VGLVLNNTLQPNSEPVSFPPTAYAQVGFRVAYGVHNLKGGDMKFYRLVLLTLLLALAGVAANAQCSNYYNVVPDGRISPDYYSVSASTANAHFFTVTAGHSYSAEVSMPFDSFLTVPFTVFINETAGGSCSLSNSGVTVNDATYIDPNPGTGNANVTRLTFTALTSGHFGYVVVNNTDTGSAHSYVVTVSETTMFNPSWTTFSPYLTQWGLQNTTGATIHAVLTVKDAISGGPYTKSVTIGAGSVAFITTSSTFSGGPIPANHNGNAILTHDGPPGAILANTYIISSTVVFPAEFRTVRENNH
jgi:hypothetical protein